MVIKVEVVIPVLNEEHALPLCIQRLIDFTTSLPEMQWSFLVADNGSEDGTLEVATELALSNPNIRVTRLEKRGRGRAIRKAWLESDADVRCYMDVDLSTDLKFLPELIFAVANDGYDLAIGSRLLRDSEVVGRPFKREMISRVYSLLFRSMFFTSFKDAQCGFKAISAEASEKLLPMVRDNGWFFDTELLILAERYGYRIKEIGVRWVDDPDSRVRIVSTALSDLKGLLRLRFSCLKWT